MCFIFKKNEIKYKKVTLFYCRDEFFHYQILQLYMLMGVCHST